MVDLVDRTKQLEVRKVYGSGVRRKSTFGDQLTFFQASLGLRNNIQCGTSNDEDLLTAPVPSYFSGDTHEAGQPMAYGLCIHVVRDLDCARRLCLYANGHS